MGRPAPTFWWDFYGTDQEHPVGVIVQSDYPGGAVLARFPGPTGAKTLEPQIAQAQELIADFKAGRKTPTWAGRN
jgi:hypothetical protein